MLSSSSLFHYFQYLHWNRGLKRFTYVMIHSQMGPLFETGLLFRTVIQVT